jgi:hypothetical protein
MNEKIRSNTRKVYSYGKVEDDSVKTQMHTKKCLEFIMKQEFDKS